MRRFRGLSLVEVVIGLALGAMLLTAVASALHAASYSTRTNERFAKATQTARVAMLQMTTLIRTSLSCDAGDLLPDAQGHWPDATTLRFQRNDNGKFFAYHYDADTNELRYCPNPDLPAATDPVLARNISKLTFRGQGEKRLPPGAPAGATLESHGEWVLVSVQIDLTVTVNNESVHLSNAVVPRKVMTVR